MRRILFHIKIFVAVICLPGCKQPGKQVASANLPPQIQTLNWKIERYSKEMDHLFETDVTLDILGSGMMWAEGPLWIPEKKWLLCSDVKANRIYRWTESGGFEVYLEPSGFTGTVTDSREPGSNGLALDNQGRLVLCQHGNRQVARMEGGLENPKPNFEILAEEFEGWRLNSPNDLVYDSKGNLFFTDPPFGLSEALDEDPNKELPFQGIYRLDKKNQLVLVNKEISRPNGIAFSPDEKKLYVSNTDGENAKWFALTLNQDLVVSKIEEIYNATALIGKEIGYPDGIKVDPKGNIFTAGPGGLWVFNKHYELIGKIKPDAWVSNCAFDNTYENLYITADSYLLRIKLQNNSVKN